MSLPHSTCPFIHQWIFRLLPPLGYCGQCFLCLVFWGLQPASGSLARGRIGDVAAGLHHSHSNSGSEPCLWPTPQLMATPLTFWAKPHVKPHPHGSETGSLPLSHNRNAYLIYIFIFFFLTKGKALTMLNYTIEMVNAHQSHWDIFQSGFSLLTNHPCQLCIIPN